MRDGERERKKENESIYLAYFPQQLGLGQGWSWEPRIQSRSPALVSGTHDFEPSAPLAGS